MDTENAVRTAVGFFVMILVGTLVSAVIGGAFGGIVALVSPEFVNSLFGTENVLRYACAVGMIWGVFIGAGVSCGVCFLAAVVKIFRIRLEHKKG